MFLVGIAFVTDFDNVDAVAFDGDNLDGVIGVNELIDSMNLNLLTIEKSLTCRCKTRYGSAMGSNLYCRFQLIDLTVNFLVETEATPCLTLQKQYHKQHAERDGTEQYDGADMVSKKCVGLPYAESYQQYTERTGHTARQSDNLERQ